MKAVLTSGALLAFLAIACQGGGEGPPAATPTVTGTTATAMASPAPATPGTTPELEREPGLIFLRPAPEPSGQRVGVIHWSSGLAGSNVVQLTPGDVRASFVGLAEKDGTIVLYYIAADEIRNVFTLEARDLRTGETTTLASIEPTEHGDLQEASLSPDGRYVAWSHPDGVDLLDLTANSRRRILTRKACDRYPPSECYSYHTSTWSPDGRLLLVQKAFWEGGAAVVVDPFQEAPQELGKPSASAAAWSPSSDAWCGGLANYDAPSGLYVSEEPEWRARNLLPEYETYEPGAPLCFVTDCVWLDEQRIAFATRIEEPSERAYQYSSPVSIYDLATGGVTALADFGAAWPPELFAVPGTSTLVFNDRESGQPGLLDTTNGTRTFTLQSGDLVVAVTQPVSLPEDIVAASPQARPCVPLTAHCEARVTSEAPRLNIREGPSQETDVMGTLSEGEIVCLTSSSQFGEDGFRWWPIASQGGAGGWWWVAQGDPQEPDRPWLTPTGRKCETPEETPHAQSAEVATTPTPAASPKTPGLRPGWTKIEPGGDTICAKGTPYAFFVHPGTIGRSTASACATASTPWSTTRPRTT